jgi:hypothetical protein
MLLGVRYIAGCLLNVRLKLWSDKGNSSYLPVDRLVLAISSVALENG